MRIINFLQFGRFSLKLLVLTVFIFNCAVFAQNSSETRKFSGSILTQRFELVPNVTIEVQTSDEKLQTVSNAEGNFSLNVPNEPLSVKFSGKNIEPQTRIFAPSDKLENLQIKINYVVSPINESVTIQAETLTPEIETRNDTIYKNTLKTDR